MKNRNFAIDMARGISLLTLPVVHSALFYAPGEIIDTTLGQLLAFVAEFVGAPVFMVAMGWSIAQGGRKSMAWICSKSIWLLLMGYLLNFLKFDLLFCAGLLPDSFFEINNIGRDWQGMLHLLMIGDILQLAAISYFIGALLMRATTPHSKVVPVLFAAVILLSPLTWQLSPLSHPLGSFVSLLNGMPPTCFFPLFPWLAYPLAGMLFHRFTETTDKKRHLSLVCMIAVVMILAGSLLLHWEPVSWHSNFYRLGPAGTIIHVASAVLFVCICSFISGKWVFKNQNSLLQILSKNVTAVYFIQWLLVCWCMIIFGYRQLRGIELGFAIIIITSLTIFFSTLYDKLKKR
ncbi:heparan-alpha-glucosaminide N-acetyltransferase domain-containing protein [Niabella insulamsoli]|uniref:heparan-alpha-glucosaminide N-acetyltransferase domain-containing protein n=1 Tax=Niabella insulamsoli TaxID=3144874 RepID=UPI0031FC1085